MISGGEIMAARLYHLYHLYHYLHIVWRRRFALSKIAFILCVAEPQFVCCV